MLGKLCDIVSECCNFISSVLLSRTSTDQTKIMAVWPGGYKTFFILNSVEHKILNAHKYKNIKKFAFFQTQIRRECYFSRS